MEQAEIKERISRLIEKFDRLTASGQIKQYNEAQTRNEFIEPLFELLGWDMRDLENEYEVTTEETVSQGRVDLAFRLNNIPVMFLEAKAAKVDLDEWKWAEQAINYSWNKGVTWAILTDFEGIKVFNAELPPQGVQYNLFFELKYTQYLSDFDQLWLLSKESFLKNLLTEQAQKWGKVVLRKPVGKKLLESLTEWRDTLSSQFHAYNPDISMFLLDEGVQKLVDRLIFIRTTEDRKIEQNILLTIKRNWESNGRKSDLFKELNIVFKDYCKTYDSKLFEPHDFETWDTPPAETLAKIIEELYETNEGYRYDFSAIDSDVLGGIYEQYLGHVLQRAKKETVIEEKHAKRKSQGIFYTPSYIVNFIVQETLGKILKEKNSNDIRNLKILDPACGSGSFLLKAYSELTRYYSANNKIFEKIRILKSNIYGVDLDSQAIEIARLNLLLQTVESKDLLPDLSSNIKNGNSLISGEETTLKKYFGSKWRDQKPFNWDEEFPEVQKSGGFDVIIGNPPYVNIANIEDAGVRNFLRENYTTAKNKSDLYSFFTEKSLSLLKNGGQLGYIFSNSWLGTDSFSKFRQFLIENTKITKLVKLPPGVFPGAMVTTILIILEKAKVNEDHSIDLFEYQNGEFIQLPQKLGYKRIIDSPNYDFSFESEIKFKNKTIKLGQLAKFSLGIKTSDDKRFVHDSKIDETSYPLLRGKDMERYSYKYANKWIWYRPDLMMEKKGAGPRKLEYFLTKKIIIRGISGGKIMANLDNNKYLVNDKIHVLYKVDKKYNFEFILGIMNSKLVNYWIKSTFGALLEIKINQLQEIPIPDKDESRSITDLVKNILSLNKEKVDVSQNTDKWHSINKEIEKTDKKIDEEVYKLYGLTEEEIRIVEESV